MRKHTKNCRFHRIIDSPLFHFDSSIKRVHTTDTSLWTWGNTRRTVLIIDQLIRVMFLIEIWPMSQIWLVSHPKTIFAFVPWIKTSCQLSSLLFIRFGNGVKSCSISLLSVRQCRTEQLKSFVGDTGLSSSMVIPNAVENLVSSHSDLSTDIKSRECYINGQWWVTMGNNGQQWITMGNNGQPWATMGNHGQQWTTMDNNPQCYMHLWCRFSSRLPCYVFCICLWT